MDPEYVEMISFILDYGSNEDLARCFNRLHSYIVTIDPQYIVKAEQGFTDYLKNLRETVEDGMYPFDFTPKNPISILSTSLALSRLLEFDMIDDKLTEKIISELASKQNEQGWWRDSDDIMQVQDLPFYQDPTNASVRIFNSMFTASSLAHIQNEEVFYTLQDSVEALNKVTAENGIIPGFPQSNWFATKLLARIHGLDSSRFLLHWSVLSDLADKINDPGSLASIAENLIEAGVPIHDPLIQKCRRKILSSIETANIDGKIYRGWYDSSKILDTSVTLRCLIILKDDEDTYLSKYKISKIKR